MTADTTVTWREGDVTVVARWQSEAGMPPPERISPVDDSLRADVALKRLRAGEALMYRGDFRNARQLLASLERRLKSTSAKPAPNLREAFHRGRARKATEHALLSRLLVSLDPDLTLRLKHAPKAVTSACQDAWGAASFEAPTALSLRELLGILGAEEWRRVGIEVPGLPGRIHPHYGVFTPTRGDYPALLAKAPSPKGLRVFDVGCGTGVLGFLMLQAGAASVVATDTEPRAVACSNENAQRLGFADRFTALTSDLFPEGRADRIVCNPPWLPAAARTPMDRAVYDPGAKFLTRFLEGLAAHLEPGGEGWLLLSDLPERLGLREEGALEAELERCGLTVVERLETAPSHPKSQDPSDPLHAARASERTRLFRLAPR